MSVVERSVERVPAGAWRSDSIHSSLEFAVTHNVVSTFRARMTDFAATLTAADDGAPVLEGVGRVESVVTPEPALNAHLQSPDFFDAERHPETRFRSTSIERRGEDGIVVSGELAIKGVTRPVELRGTIAGPVVGLGDAERLGLELEGTVDRTEFGLNWNAPLPNGGFAVGNEVRLSAHLELVREA
jgi:polyisoprenoid-binding protein YceI